MGIRCSLTGHVWGDIQSDMDKEINGDEIAVTEIEYQECTRCDERRTISENTEVRSMGGDDDGMDEGGNPAAANVVNEVFSGGGDAPEDDAVIMDEPGDEEGGVQEGVEEAGEEGGEEEMEERRREYEGAEVTHTDESEEDEAAGGGPSVLACPRCSFEAPATDGSLREGDICPECGEGYIEKRPS